MCNVCVANNIVENISKGLGEYRIFYTDNIYLDIITDVKNAEFTGGFFKIKRMNDNDWSEFIHTNDFAGTISLLCADIRYASIPERIKNWLVNSEDIFSIFDVD